ncbi:DctP family TRAP transporter solute-binding subunit [Wukongibacter sp. M2B1]|uniref:TRAP transporter substrate-binding protein n=1 Tax=Wukongibacter sp. M2B1 TaxID=3088895 RepID=UPI003D7A5BC8
MKKSVALVLMVSLLLSLMVGCSKKEKVNTTTKVDSKEIVIKVGHIEAEDRSTHKACLEFEKYVEEQSDGKVDVQIYPNGQLGGDREMTEGVALGTLQMTLPATSVLTTYDAKFGILDMPFIFNNEHAGFAALDGELGTKLNECLPPVGLYNFGYNYNGARNISNNVRPINEPNDLKGIKMRVMESPVYIDLFKYLGANATPMGFGEVFTGLQQGTIDGQENGASLVYATKFYEVQKYYSLTGHTYGFLAVLINDSFYNELPDDIRKIVSEGAEKYLIDYQRNLEIEDNEKYIKKLKDEGMEVNAITPENQEKFVEALKPMYEKYKKEIGKEMFGIVDQYNQ